MGKYREKFTSAWRIQYRHCGANFTMETFTSESDGETENWNSAEDFIFDAGLDLRAVQVDEKMKNYNILRELPIYLLLIIYVKR